MARLGHGPLRSTHNKKHRAGLSTRLSFFLSFSRVPPRALSPPSLPSFPPSFPRAFSLSSTCVSARIFSHFCAIFLGESVDRPLNPSIQRRFFAGQARAGLSLSPLSFLRFPSRLPSLLLYFLPHEAGLCDVVFPAVEIELNPAWIRPFFEVDSGLNCASETRARVLQSWRRCRE